MNLEKIKRQKSISELLEFSIINIDKPSSPTSFSVDEIVKKKLKARKTSHFGTLDPKVTGVLPVALNRACRLTGYFMQKDKTYVGIMKLHTEISEEKLKKEMQRFVGKIKQLPPVKSRVKREERERRIYSWEILEKQGKEVLFEAEVEAGTYIRKLIHDLGLKIGGAHMSELRRVKAGIFSEAESVNLYDFEKAVEEWKAGKEEKLREILIPGEIISEILPVVEVKKESLKKLWNGSPLFKDFLSEKTKLESEKIVVFFDDVFVGVYNCSNEKEIIARPEFVFKPI